jgi:hypothetical protein
VDGGDLRDEQGDQAADRLVGVGRVAEGTVGDDGVVVAAADT